MNENRNPCVVCARNAPNAYLCGQCVSELKNMLHGLAQGQPLPSAHHGQSWIENLEDVVYGKTRQGESARRSTEHSAPLLVNLEASATLDDITNMLWKWIGAINTSTETMHLPGETP